MKDDITTSSNTLPSVSVITVSLNAKSTIRKTLDSVLNQTHSKVEYIVIDGGSEDGTAEIVQSYATDLAYFESKRDKGPYYAMNRGATFATNDYINFMNAGDHFASRDAIQLLFEQATPGVDVVYGDCSNRVRGATIHRSAKPLDTISYGLMTSHQSIFTRRQLVQSNPFDTDYSMVADYTFFFDRVLGGSTFQHVPVEVAVFDRSGMSTRQPLRVLMELWSASNKRRNTLATNAHFASRLPIKAIQSLLLRVSPELHDFVLEKIVRRIG